MRAMLVPLLIVVGSMAQARSDSLLRVLRTLPQDTSRLPVLTAILRATVFSLPDTALAYAAQYRSIAEMAGDDMEQGKGHNYTGMCWSVKGVQDKALAHYLAALRHFERGDDPWYTAMAHNNIASVYKEERRSADAQREFTEALRLFRTVHDTVWIANVGSNLANLHFDAGAYDSAAYHYERAAEVLGDGPSVFAAQIGMNRANALSRSGRQAEALTVVRRAAAIHPIGEDERHRANVLICLGGTQGANGIMDSALINIRQGLALAYSTSAGSVIIGGEDMLADHFQRIGRPDSALVHFKRARTLNDSLLNAERSERIAEMQVKYESGLKDAELIENRAALERRSLVIKGIAAGAALLLLAAFLAFRGYRTKRRSEAELVRKNGIIQEQLREKELLLREIHHRVKNNLQTVSSLLSMQGRSITDTAARQAVNEGRLRVKSMALIHQDLYREGDLTGVRMKEYVEKLASSLLQSYARADDVELTCRVHEIDLDVDTAVPVGLILNELITNALKYAWPDATKGMLTITLALAADALQLEVRDDGIGYDPQAERSEAGTGFGLGMIRTFAGKLKAEWTISREQGTVVELVIRNFKLAR